MGTESKRYEWDVAFSLCQQDTEFAGKLAKALNSSLKVFFYEHRQEELISKSGPEVFAKTFKELSRVVVILSRSEWGKSFYTELESNAIVDGMRTRGLQFIMVIPMVQDEIPVWYPATRIYASPFKFGIEEIARFIEFKVTEEGGNVKQLTVEDRYQHLLNNVEEKKALIALQTSTAAIECAKKEISVIKESFNRKSDFLRSKIFDKVSWDTFNSNIHPAILGYGDYELHCKLHFPDLLSLMFTTQDCAVSFTIFKILPVGNSGREQKELVDQEIRLFYYRDHLHGWAVRDLRDQPTNKELQVLFRNRDNSQFYDLIKPLRSEQLVDDWFQKLLSLSTQRIERYV